MRYLLGWADRGYTGKRQRSTCGAADSFYGRVLLDFLLVLALAAYANGASLDTCQVSEWSAWSECTSSKYCPKVKIPVFSYEMEETDEWDTGRDTMQKIMKAKANSWKTADECRTAGTCPERNRRPLAGAYPCTGGIAGDIPCSLIDQRSFLTFAQMGYNNPVPGDNSPNGNDVWGWIDPLNNDEYAIMGFTGGTAFVRITNPENPVPVGFIYTQTVSSSWRDIKVIGNYAYIVSEARDHGLQVFDLTRLRGRSSVEYFTPDARNMDFGNAHNIVSNEDTNFVYVVGATQTSGYRTCSGGLLVLDVSDPLNPRYAGCYGGDGYVHDAQCVIYNGPDATYRGREICFCFNEDSLTLVDVNNKNSMTMISKTGYVNAAYTHQGWLTEDHAVILLDDEQDEYQLPSNQQFTKTYVWDIRSLNNPVLESVFQSTERSIDHNQYIIGDYTYQANYESGLRILHINRATNTLSSVAYFDVYPSRTAADFFGTWSVFPYYPSGNVAVSSIDYGLFIVTPNHAAIKALVESNVTTAQETRTREVLSSPVGAYCPALVDTMTCSAPVLC
jgi:choice-of-anchor B domain-containing protein